MYKHLWIASLIVLFAFVGLSLVSFAHYGDGSFHAVHCTTCGEAAHMNPNDCEDHDGPEPVYQHASDCPCNTCVAERESPEANNETSFEDMVDSWGGALSPWHDPINTTLDYLRERYDDFISIPREYPYYEP